MTKISIVTAALQAAIIARSWFVSRRRCTTPP
jgi:hypothetical protein